MGCTSPPAASVIAELATRGISRHCRRRPPSVVAGPAVLSPAPTMSPKRCRGADSPSSLGIPPIPPPPTPNLAWPGQRRTVREHDTRGNDGGFAPLGASCRRVTGVSWLYWCNSPRLLAARSRSGAVRPRFEVTRRPHRRPPRRQTPTTGCRGRGSLHCGHNDAWPRVSLAREPAIACANRLYRTQTRYSVSGQGCPRSHQRVNVRISGPRLTLAGPGADQRAHVRGVGPACAASAHPRSSFACNSTE